MKKKLAILLAAGTVIFTTAATAQTTFGVRGGLDFFNINGKDVNGNKMSNKLIPGMHAGVNVEIPVAPDFYVQPGVLFRTRGAKYPNDAKVHLAYLEIPVNFVYKPALGRGHLIAGAGPYVDFGLGGRVVYDDNTPNGKVRFTNKDVNPGENDNVYYRRVGAGANLLFGYEFANKLSFQLNTQLGLTDINPKYGGSSKATAKHTGFGISAGYRF